MISEQDQKAKSEMNATRTKETLAMHGRKKGAFTKMSICNFPTICEAQVQSPCLCKLGVNWIDGLFAAAIMHKYLIKSI